MAAPIFTHPRFLPASKINGAQIDHAVISDGCIINPSRISHSLIGIRSIVGAGSTLHRVVSFGGDYYESDASIREAAARGWPRIGIGGNTHISNAIIDKNARIGSHVVISPQGKPENFDHDLYCIRDGIVVIPKNGVIPDGTRL
jgi:glucose-1-phosphate adenylyltransferase